MLVLLLSKTLALQKELVWYRCLLPEFMFVAAPIDVSLLGMAAKLTHTAIPGHMHLKAWAVTVWKRPKKREVGRGPKLNTYVLL